MEHYIRGYWIRVWVTGKTVWSLVNPWHFWSH